MRSLTFPGPQHNFNQLAFVTANGSFKASDTLSFQANLYRREFRTSEQLRQPYVMAGVNVIAAETAEVAERELQAVRRARAVRLFGRAGGIRDADLDAVDDDLADQLLAGGAGAHVDQLLTYMAAGNPAQVSRYLDRFRDQIDADELIAVFASPSSESRLRSATLLAEAMQPVRA